MIKQDTLVRLTKLAPNGPSKENITVHYPHSVIEGTYKWFHESVLVYNEHVALGGVHTSAVQVFVEITDNVYWLATQSGSTYTLEIIGD